MATIKARQGYANCFFQKVSVSSASFSAATTPDVVVNVNGLNNFSLSNETPSTVIEVSFDGNFIQDELDSSQTTKFVLYNNRTISTVWFRMKSGAAGVVTIRAW